MNYRDHLMLRASTFWAEGTPLPTDLFSEMLSAGIDVAEAEKNFQLTHQYN